MKREIKFRGKDCNTGEWVYGDLHLLCDKPHIHTAPSNFPYAGKRAFVDPETIGQFTGLYDKNGLEIYEGDIIRTDGNNFTYEVIYNEKSAAFIGKRNSRVFGLLDLYESDTVYIEIIGNIHDNKELLTQN